MAQYSTIFDKSMQKTFNFKLLVPPRPHVNQVSALKPTMNEENCVFSQHVQGYNKCADMETSLPFPSKMVLPTTTSRPASKKAAVIPMEKEETLRSSQLFTRLLDEAEKIKVWKVKIDSEMSQKDRRLQENRKTIETQRKAIQELQFANESLSMKLEDQLHENEDLRNKSNATRNLCNLLKDTFERSFEKMSVFEAEREQTHDLFVQNNENIQRIGEAFESLRKQAEADQQDMLKLQECLSQMEGLKVKFESDLLVKKKEVSMLQEKVCEKEGNLQEVSLKLQETQQNCNLLQESERQYKELLQNLTQDRELLEEKLKATDQSKLEIEKNLRALTEELGQSNEDHAKILQRKDAELEELNNIKEQQSHQLAEIHLTVKSLQSSVTSQSQRAQDLETKLSSVLNDLSDKTSELEKITGQKVDFGKQIQILKDGLDEKSELLNSVKEKLHTSEIQTCQLTAALVEKENEACHLKEAVEKTKHIEESLIKARQEFEDLQKEAVSKENKLKEIEEHLARALESGCKSSKEVKRLQNDIEQQNKKYEELKSKFNDVQMQKDTIQEQVDCGAKENNVLQSQLLESKANEEMDKLEIKRLKEEKQQLLVQVDILTTKIAGQDEESKSAQEMLKESGSTSKKELQMKDKQIKSLESKLINLKRKLEIKEEAYEDCLKEITTLRDESEKAKKLHKEEFQKICSNVKDKSTSEAQRSLEVEKLKQTATEALKSKEEIETKCQQKISDIVALMERHKREYDKMIEEKDAELSEKRMKEAEVNASKALLEFELSHLQGENNELREELEKVKGDKVAMKTSSPKKDTPQQITETKLKKGRKRISKTPQISEPTMAVYSFLNEKENDSPSGKGSPNPVVGSFTFLTFISFTSSVLQFCFLFVGAAHQVPKSPFWSLSAKYGTTPQIKSYRVRTPPRPEVEESWKTNFLKLDPKSDSSESNCILNFSPRPLKTKKPMQPKDPESDSIFKKMQSSDVCKSPGTALKLAAIKRMRDAGWTSISSHKKKKKISEKIFA